MTITVGKVVWTISVLIFLLFAYNTNPAQRLIGTIETWMSDTGYETVQTFDPAAQEEMAETAPSEERVDDFDMDTLGGVGGVEAAGDDASGALSEPEPENIPEEHYEMMLEIEKVKWRVQELENDYMKLEAEHAVKEGDSTTGDLATILATLLPLFIPYFTRKKNNQELFKKG